MKQVEIDRYGHHKYNCCVVITLSVMLMKERWITLFTGSCKTMTPCMLNKESLAKGSIGWPRAIYVHGGHQRRSRGGGAQGAFAPPPFPGKTRVD